MRPMTRRLTVLAAATTTATAALVAPAAQSSATTVGLCVSRTTIDWSVSGEFNAILTASVSGVCSVPGWTTCDIRIAGAIGVLAGERTADYTSCGATVTMVGVQNTPYVAVGTVGYSAAEAPVSASVARAVPRG